MSVVMTRPVPRETEEKLPKRWTLKDVERFTGLEIVGVRENAEFIVCTLSNGITFSFRKW